jgi:hypothetical protein
VLGRIHPEVAGFSSAFVIVTRAELRDEIGAAVSRLVDAANARRSVEIEHAVDQILTSFAPRSDDQELASKRQAQVRLRVLRNHPVYTSAEIAERFGSRARNRAQLASHWRGKSRIFSVPVDGSELYFTFQFDDKGKPLPVLRDVLRRLSAWEPWDIAVWFVSPNPLLERRIPAEELGRDPDAVAEAAHLDARVRRDR